MNDQAPINESRLRVPANAPSPELRQQVLSLVSSQLRTRRRDRRIGWLSVGLLVFATATNSLIGQYESARLARWYSPASQLGVMADGTALANSPAKTKSTKTLIQDYYAAVYQPPQFFSNARASIATERELARSLRELSSTTTSTNGGT